MAPILGKRKRRAELNETTQFPEHKDEEHDRLRALFQAHFEERYEPLTPTPAPPHNTLDQTSQSDSDDQDEDEDAWSGISEPKTNDKPVEIISHATLPAPSVTSKHERKTFMTSKPPSVLPTTNKPGQKATSSSAVTSVEKSLLKSDLELQRLLRESHLLHPSSNPSTATPLATLTTRHKATDLHLASLGAKTSVFSQKSMPAQMRKGIVAKKVRKEKERRQEAKREGVVLEREGGTERKRGKTNSGRNVGDPGVGKWQGGGTLRLSRKDVEGIVGREGGRGGVGRGGRGGKKGGRGTRR